MTGHVPVIIVGAGPVGVTAATLLARRGIASVLLEKYQAPYPLPRAVHLDDEVARILQAAGVAEQFAKTSRPMPGMRLVDAQHKTMAEFNRAGGAGPNGYPRANMFDQPELEQILLDNLAAHPLVTLRRGCEVTSVEGTGPVTVRYTQDGAEHQITSGTLGCATCTSRSGGWSSTCGHLELCATGAACTRSAIRPARPRSCT